MKHFSWLLMGFMLLFLAVLPLAGCVSKSQYEALQAKHTVLIEENTTLKAELAQIERVYPPRHFNSTSELQNWLRNNDVSEHSPTRPSGVHAWYLNALEIQEDAARDGYIVSASISPSEQEGLYVVFCSAIAGGSLWWWYPEDDEINQIPGFAQVR